MRLPLSARRSLMRKDTVLLELAIGAGALAYLSSSHGPTPYDALFDSIGRELDVPPNMLRAIARVESSFNASAVNAASGDVGLMQINPATARALGVTLAALSDPATSVRTAARVLADSRRTLTARGRFSAYTWAMSYNVGPDLSPAEAGAVYAMKVSWHWTLYDLARLKT